MKFYSTNNKNNIASFKDAVLKGLADDGGLFMPEKIPDLDKSFVAGIGKYSFQEIAFEILSKYSEDEISISDLSNIVDSTLTFPAPIAKLDDHLNVLELFHGPTLAFKDFGARFTARLISHFIKGSDKKLNILVATSGDTGSAVANGFYGIDGINVYLLYPSGKVSDIQEKQLTTLDKNITALEIKGTFDDCQRMVKAAFVDEELNKHLNLSSANSINIARLVPQIFYYFEAYKQLLPINNKFFVSVPSGNLGNLTAGLFAKFMGLPVDKFVSAVNSNRVFPEYLATGKFVPRPSVKTLSNAMDVGNPSNLARIMDLFNNNVSAANDVIFSSGYDDAQTVKAIRNIYDKYDYVIDPHGAVGYLSLTEYVESQKENNYTGVILETAHPAKFKDAVEEAINSEVKIPERLQESIEKEKKSVVLSNEYSAFKEFLMER